MSAPSQKPGPFPDDFLFGVATAAYQIEGAVDIDGRKPSIWDTYSHEPGRVLNGDTGNIACNHYHLWESDLDLIKSMHVGAYRFSLSWSRLIPDGTGVVNQKGLDFYDRLIDGCLERNLKPFVTLYHWDLPQTLQDNGGWAQRSTAEAFAAYAALVVNEFGDRIDCISTFNEPWCSAILGNLMGVHAPGNQDLALALKCVHHQHLAHGLATKTIKSIRPELPVGIVLNLQSVYAAEQGEEHDAAVDRHRDFHNHLFTDPLFEGRYPQSVMNVLGQNLPDTWEKDLQTIQQPLDYWGLNYYQPTRVLHDKDSTANFPQTKDAPKAHDATLTDLGWEVAPATMVDLLSEMYQRYDLPPCFITENGACYNDSPVNGEVKDDRRIEYLDAHLKSVSQAISLDIPVQGYFAWSLMDNFEWSEGYDSRFGLVFVDYKTQTRTVKKSGHWYAQLAEIYLS